MKRMMAELPIGSSGRNVIARGVSRSSACPLASSLLPALGICQGLGKKAGMGERTDECVGLVEELSGEELIR